MPVKASSQCESSNLTSVFEIKIGPIKIEHLIQIGKGLIQWTQEDPFPRRQLPMPPLEYNINQNLDPAATNRTEIKNDILISTHKVNC